MDIDVVGELQAGIRILKDQRYALTEANTKLQAEVERLQGQADGYCVEYTEQKAENKRQYRKGYEDGLRAYAWWKDGVEYVGTCGTTLEQALKNKEWTMAYNVDKIKEEADRTLKMYRGRFGHKPAKQYTIRNIRTCVYKALFLCREVKRLKKKLEKSQAK